MMLFGQQSVGGPDLLGGGATVEAQRGVVVELRALQNRGLTCSRRQPDLMPDGRGGGLREQGRPLEQTTKFLFAGAQVRAVTGVGIHQRFILHLEPLQIYNAEKLSPVFPNLALLQLHNDRPSIPAWRRTRAWLARGTVSPAFGRRRDSHRRNVIVSSQRPIWRRPPAFSSGQHCWPPLVFGSFSSGWI